MFFSFTTELLVTNIFYDTTHIINTKCNSFDESQLCTILIFFHVFSKNYENLLSSIKLQNRKNYEK